MRSLIRDFFSYLRHPHLTHIPQKIKNPGFLLIKLTCICLSLGMTAGLIGGMLVSFKIIPTAGPSDIEGDFFPKYMLLLGPLILGPVMEELVFRAQLRRVTGSILFVSLMIGVILSASVRSLWGLLISPPIFSILFVIYRFTIPASVTLKYRVWNKIIPWHFYFTALCFALIHLHNFKDPLDLLPLGILYTLPQFAVGLVLGYTRMKYGIKYAIALHALNNFLPALLLFLKY